jgi:hypothetical protein
VKLVARRSKEPKTPEEWIKRFIRAAEQRRDSAKRLEDASMFIDQMYLTGYVVECALKALIVNDASASDRRSALVDVTRGATAHDFEHLRQIYRRRNRQFPIQGSRMLRSLIKIPVGDSLAL